MMISTGFDTRVHFNSELVKILTSEKCYILWIKGLYSGISFFVFLFVEKSSDPSIQCKYKLSKWLSILLSFKCTKQAKQWYTVSFEWWTRCMLFLLLNISHIFSHVTIYGFKCYVSKRKFFTIAHSARIQMKKQLPEIQVTLILGHYKFSWIL